MEESLDWFGKRANAPDVMHVGRRSTGLSGCRPWPDCRVLCCRIAPTPVHRRCAGSGHVSILGPNL